MAYYVPTAEAPPRRESLAKTPLAHSHPSTPARLPAPPEDSEEEDLDDDDEDTSVADTAETFDTANTYTGVSYRFPTSGGSGNLARTAGLAGTVSPGTPVGLSGGGTPISHGGSGAATGTDTGTGTSTPSKSMAGVASTSVGPSMAGVASTSTGMGVERMDLSTPTGSIGSNGSRGPLTGSYF